jgi:hypothetical protein
MWVNAMERLPEKDGEYKYQTVYGTTGCIFYTVEGGWNTNRDKFTGELCNEYAMENDGYIARWFDAPDPEPVPEEWLEEYRAMEDDK